MGTGSGKNKRVNNLAASFKEIKLYKEWPASAAETLSSINFFIQFTDNEKGSLLDENLDEYYLNITKDNFTLKEINYLYNEAMRDAFAQKILTHTKKDEGGAESELIDDLLSRIDPELIDVNLRQPIAKDGSRIIMEFYYNKKLIGEKTTRLFLNEDNPEGDEIYTYDNIPAVEVLTDVTDLLERAIRNPS